MIRSAKLFDEPYATLDVDFRERKRLTPAWEVNAKRRLATESRYRRGRKKAKLFNGAHRRRDKRNSV